METGKHRVFDYLQNHQTWTRFRRLWPTTICRGITEVISIRKSTSNVQYVGKLHVSDLCRWQLPLDSVQSVGFQALGPGWKYHTVQNCPASQRQQTKFCKSSNLLFIQDKKNNAKKKVTEAVQFFKGSFNTR